MRLHEALRASKRREAVGFLPDAPRLRAGGLNIPVAEANDGGVKLIVFDETGLAVDVVERHWTALLPNDLGYVQSLIWEAVDPKSPLIQLADTLTDFSEAEESDG